MSKLAIITLPFGPNYGFVLQAFALKNLLDQDGRNDVKLLYRGWNQDGSRTLLFKLKRWIYYNIICGKPYKFYKSLNPSPIVRSSDELFSYCKDKGIQTVVFGSDQVWRIENVRGAGLDFFGEAFFKKGSIQMCSYSASFGKDSWMGTSEETQRISNYLKEFKTISVREDSGNEICKKNFNVEAKVALDPTIMLDDVDYNSIISKPRKTHWLTTYILDSTDEKTTAIKAISKKYNLKIVNLYKKNSLRFGSVEKWLESIRDAEYVVVDSFHGMVFSIIFKKQFVVIANKERGLTRFVSLLTKLNLLDRLIDDPSHAMQVISQPINYIMVYDRLKEEREKSYRILEEICNS